MSVSVALPPIAIDAGLIVFASVGGALTVRSALAGGASPALVDSVPVVLVTVPGVHDVIATTIVQPPAGTLLPAAMVIDAAATVTPVHVPVLPEVVVTPAGILSTKLDDSVTAAALPLPSVSVIDGRAAGGDR